MVYTYFFVGLGPSLPVCENNYVVITELIDLSFHLFTSECNWCFLALLSPCHEVVSFLPIPQMCDMSHSVRIKKSQKMLISAEVGFDHHRWCGKYLPGSAT